jgi:hypothetical protein
MGRLVRAGRPSLQENFLTSINLTYVWQKISRGRSIGGLELVGVWLSNYPLDVGQIGASRGRSPVTLRIALDLPATALERYELIEDEKPYREWCISAALVNAHGTVTTVTDDEAAALRDEAWRSLIPDPSAMADEPSVSTGTADPEATEGESPAIHDH